MALTLNLLPLADLAPALTSSTVALPKPLTRRYLPFGLGYARHAFPISVDDGEDGDKSKAADDGSAARQGRRDMGDRKKNVKLSEEDMEVDWYDLLKLPNGEGSSDEQIRTAYRRRCLETHPDKQPDGSDVEFKRVQRAFEILGNPEARRSYDSSRPFDDSIPPETVAEKDFYRVFGPVFERNKKWSANEIPSLGDDDTPVAEVKKIYDQWLLFRTWRDFSNVVELQEIDEGMYREEKRYYQRENQRMLDKAQKEELKRVRLLVDRAIKNDPRLRRQREAEEAAREEAKRQREATRLAAIEAERQAREEAIAKEKAAEEAKKQAALDTKNRQKAAAKAVADFLKQNNLVDTVDTNKLLASKVRRPNVQWMLQNANVQEAEAIRDAVLAASTAETAEAPPAGAAEEDGATSHVPAVIAFNTGIQGVERRLGRNRYGEGIKSVAETVAAKPKPKPGGAKEAKWSDDDLILLQKLAIKYPGGAVDRWRHIAANLGNRYTEEQVLEQVKQIETQWRGGVKPPSAVSSGVPDAPTAAPAAAADEWTANQQKQLEQGLRELKDYKEKDKYNKIAAKVDGKTAKQCFERFKFLCAMRKKAAQ